MYEVNIRKRKRNCGKSYTTKTGKIVPSKTFTNLDCQCVRKCSNKISELERKKLFDNFWALGDINHQNSYLNGLCKCHSVKRRRPKDGTGSEKGCIYEYRLELAGTSLIVCKTFFLNTFNVSNGRLSRVLKKSKEEGTPHLDGRGKHEARKCISEELITDVREHIKSFPAFESHYAREDNPNKKYLNPELNMAKIYDLYLEKCRQEHKPFVGEHIYRKIFHKDFNLSFHPPRKDTCSFCDKMHLKIQVSSNDEEKARLVAEKELHLRKAEAARLAMSNDTQRSKAAESKKLVFTFDLQKALAFPKLTTSVAYYKRNMYVYNFGCHNLTTDQIYMYFWDEVSGSRGSQEIGSCLLKHISKSVSTENHLIAYSDTCGGQNRNFNIALMMMKVTQDPNLSVDTFDLKFLLSGHSYLPNDRDFGLIEKNLRRKGYLYSPQDIYAVIKNTGKKNRFICTEMEHCNFYALKELQNSVCRKKKNEQNGDCNWFKIRWIRFEKQKPYIMMYKEALNEEIAFYTLNLKPTRGRGRPKEFGTLRIPCLYPQLRTVAHKKKQDMLDLLPFIPAIHHGYFNNLQTGGELHEEEDGD